MLLIVNLLNYYGIEFGQDYGSTMIMTMGIVMAVIQDIAEIKNNLT